MFRFIHRLLSDFVNLIFPKLCLGCDRLIGVNERVLCSQCRLSLPETGQHRLATTSYVANQFAGKVPIQFATSYLYFKKGGVVQKLIHQIKYKGQKEAAKEIASWYGYQLKAESEMAKQIDVLIGVPLHKSRLSQRGYNQADWIAEGLAESLGVPAQADILIRERFNASQTRKNRLERWENVKTVFAVQNPATVKGKNVAVVDDVLTTGATIEACAIELLKAGCKSVGVITIAATHR
ncbi:ComF family protein [Spirosoma taeanense]|uniref:ComF family protein n=1 Tax=Spirosoma taeanense TaxID=2735870 RepID=A0A6M5YFN1_9BACT|nr:ComF family protein [Spirosoma taeanense]QJW92063.1 ComF family protein [Spirosoma taeanense]